MEVSRIQASLLCPLVCCKEDDTELRGQLVLLSLSCFDLSYTITLCFFVFTDLSV